MMNNRNAPYSDIELAGKLSQKLLPDSESTKSTTAGSIKSAQYIRFRASDVKDHQNAVSSTVQPKEQLPLRLPPDDFGASRWETFLSWCMEITSADAAFIVDEQGFIVANEGELSDEELTRIAAWLPIAATYIQEINQTPNQAAALCFEYDNRWLTNLQLNINEQLALELAMISPAVIPTEICRAIQSALVQE
ncbi:MAG: hypothetical protein AB1757_07150 [Acidobacteriota bacterium]